MKSHAKFKFNSGIGALVCSKCSRIIKEGIYFTDDEWRALRGEIKLPGQLCDICEEKLIYKDE